MRELEQRNMGIIVCVRCPERTTIEIDWSCLQVKKSDESLSGLAKRYV